MCFCFLYCYADTRFCFAAFVEFNKHKQVDFDTHNRVKLYAKVFVSLHCFVLFIKN